MKLTNEKGLPETFIKAMQADPYFKGFGVDYSVSELIAPVRQVILKQRHWTELTEDASDGIWKLLGKSCHYILEKAGIKNALQEERITLEVLGRKVSGAFDFWHDEVLSDYKVSSVWSAIYGSRTADWTAQLNLYDCLLSSAGFASKSLQVVAIYRDWSKSKAKHDPEYPQMPVAVVPLQLWSREDQRKYLELKIKNLIIAENDSDEELVECSEEQMWATPDKWAVMKEGRKSAVKLFEDEVSATAFSVPLPKHSVVKRPGEHKRCLEYCPVRDFCSQHKFYLETRTANSGDDE
jgi:hypothetical protein